MWVRIPSAPMHMQVVCNNVEIERSESNKSSLTQYNFQFALGTHRTLSQAGFIACYIIFWYRAALQFSDYSGRRPIKVNVHGTSASSLAQAEKDVIQESWIKGCAIQADVAPAARAHPLLHPGITPCVDCCTLLVKTIPVPVVQRRHGGAAFLSLVVHLGVF